MKNLLVRNLKEIRDLSGDLEKKLPDLRQRLLEAAERNRSLEGPRPLPQAPEIAARAPDLKAEAA